MSHKATKQSRKTKLRKKAQADARAALRAKSEREHRKRWSASRNNDNLMRVFEMMLEKQDRQRALRP